MKIGMLSDIHIDANAESLDEGQSFVDLIVKKIQQENMDLFLIAGDISNDYRMSLSFLRELRDASDCPVLFVPGNHDYWSKENGEMNTQKIYEAFQMDTSSVLEKPFIINDEWAVVGNSGWYDYSFGQPDFTEEEFADMTYMDRTWQDKCFVHWGKPNPEMHRIFLEKIEKDLQAVEGRKIILMTHIITHPNFIVPMPNELFSFFNAYLGSSDYEALYRKYNIKASVMGHVHYRKSLYENGVDYICACLGKSTEWQTANVEKEVEDAIATFFIDSSEALLD